MNAVHQAYSVCLALIALGVGCWYFASATPVARLDEQTLSTSPDVVIQALTVSQFDKTGHLLHSLKTPKLEHIPLNNTHWLQSPQFMLTPNEKPPLTITSSQATAINGGQQITFEENVVIHQSGDQHTAESTLKTSEMTYFPKTQIAQTTRPIIWEQAGSIVQAVGMKAYLAEERVQLLSEARGQYEPAQG